MVTEPNRRPVDEVLDLLQVLDVDEFGELLELGARRGAKRDTEAIVAAASR